MIFAFEKLDVWSEAMALSRAVYEITKSFPDSEQFGITSQIRRAIVSIPVNIAEGKGRYHRREFLQFLYSARGSLYETLTLLKLSADLRFLSQADLLKLVGMVESIMSKLSGLINAMKQQVSESPS